MPAIRPQYLSPFSFRHSRPAIIGVLLLTWFGSLMAPSVSASTGNNAVPYIDLVAPVSANPGATGVTLTVLGTGFVATSVVKWNSSSSAAKSAGGVSHLSVLCQNSTGWRLRLRCL